MQFLRSEGGGYWTGANFDDDVFHGAGDGELYPAEQPSWNSAAVVLAANALAGTGPTAGLFRGERLPDGLSAEALLAAGVEIERERAARHRPDSRFGVAQPGMCWLSDAKTSETTQDAQAAGRRLGNERTRRDRALPHLVRGLTTVGRVFEHVVEHEQAARHDVA